MVSLANSFGANVKNRREGPSGPSAWFFTLSALLALPDYFDELHSNIGPDKQTRKFQNVLLMSRSKIDEPAGRQAVSFKHRVVGRRLYGTNTQILKARATAKG